jgi:Kef-type K+ transport system membrane component KefB
MDSTTHDLSRVLIELGLIVVSLAILARIASRWGFSAIPLYLLAGLAFGKGGLAPLNLSAGFTHIGAEIGVLLLLFMLGLEYTGHELVTNLRSAFPAAIVDFALNFTPGLVAGLLLKWRLLPAVMLGGVTYVSSSGVIAKVLAELRRLNNPETPAVLSILVIEDLAMAVYLPLVAVLLAGGGPGRMALSVSVALPPYFWFSPSLSATAAPLATLLLISPMRSYFSPFLAWSFSSPELRSGSKSRPLSAHFSWASQSPDLWLNKRIVCSRLFVTYLQPRSFSFLGFKSTRQPCRPRCPPPFCWAL